MDVVITCICQSGEALVPIFHSNTNLGVSVKYLKIQLTSTTSKNFLNNVYGVYPVT